VTELTGYAFMIGYIYMYIYIYLTSVGLTPGGSSTSHIYTKTVHIIQRRENNTEKEKLGSAGRAPSLQIIPWDSALQLRKKYGKPSVRVLYQTFF
jgi:hypothetical protein